MIHDTQRAPATGTSRPRSPGDPQLPTLAERLSELGPAATTVGHYLAVASRHRPALRAALIRRFIPSPEGTASQTSASGPRRDILLALTDRAIGREKSHRRLVTLAEQASVCSGRAGTARSVSRPQKPERDAQGKRLATLLGQALAAALDVGSTTTPSLQREARAIEWTHALHETGRLGLLARALPHQSLFLAGRLTLSDIQFAFAGLEGILRRPRGVVPCRDYAVPHFAGLRVPPSWRELANRVVASGIRLAYRDDDEIEHWVSRAALFSVLRREIADAPSTPGTTARSARIRARFTATWEAISDVAGEVIDRYPEKATLRWIDKAVAAPRVSDYGVPVVKLAMGGYQDTDGPIDPQRDLSTVWAEVTHLHPETVRAAWHFGRMTGLSVLERFMAPRTVSIPDAYTPYDPVLDRLLFDRGFSDARVHRFIRNGNAMWDMLRPLMLMRGFNTSRRPRFVDMILSDALSDRSFERLLNAHPEVQITSLFAALQKWEIDDWASAEEIVSKV